MPAAAPPRVLFLVEGFTDIRFVVGLSQICDLTMMVPGRPFRESGLAERVAESGATLRVIEIPGGRLRFQIRSLRELWRQVGGCDLILSQEVLRGSLNANIIGRLRRTPVVTYMGISPLEYFRCRRERRQIGPVTSWLGSTLIRTLVTINGRLATRCLAMGPYLRDVASQWCARSEIGLYYGVDVEHFRPADADERSRLRRRLDLPPDKFLVVLSSRISHEKDPETVLRAVALARGRGLDAVLLNLGGGHREFLALAARLGVEDACVLGARAAGRASDEGPGRLLSRRRRGGDGVARGRRGLLDARGAGLRDARRRHGGGRDGGPASRVRVADATAGRSRDGRRVPGDCRAVRTRRARRHARDASTCAASGIARRRSAIWRWCCEAVANRPSLTVAGETR